MTIDKQVLPKEYELAINSIVLISSVFLGSYSAFWLNKSKELKAEKARQKVVLEMSLFTLIRMIQGLVSFIDETAKYDSTDKRAFNMPALKQPRYIDLKFDFSALSFLFESHPQLVLALALEQERYEQMLDSIIERNKFYLENVEPALSASGLRGKRVTEAALRKAIGNSEYDGAVKSVENMFMHIDKSKVSLSDAYNELSGAARQTFPNKAFLKIENPARLFKTAQLLSKGKIGGTFQ